MCEQILSPAELAHVTAAMRPLVDFIRIGAQDFRGITATAEGTFVVAGERYAVTIGITPDLRRPVGHSQFTATFTCTSINEGPLPFLDHQGTRDTFLADFATMVNFDDVTRYGWRCTGEAFHKTDMIGLLVTVPIIS